MRYRVSFADGVADYDLAREGRELLLYQGDSVEEIELTPTSGYQLEIEHFLALVVENPQVLLRPWRRRQMWHGGFRRRPEVSPSGLATRKRSLHRGGGNEKWCDPGFGSHHFFMLRQPC